jgi:hypothetical protein
LHQPPFSFLGGYYSLPAGEYSVVSHARRRAAVLRPFSDQESSKFTPKLRPAQCCLWSSPRARRKMSGRWGDRPLGRGYRGYRGLKSARLLLIPHKAGSRPFGCAREQQDDPQEQTPDNHPNGSKNRTSFRSLESFCNRPLVLSIAQRIQYFRGVRRVAFPVPRYSLRFLALGAPQCYRVRFFLKRYSRGGYPKVRRKSALKEEMLSKPTSRQMSVTLCSLRSRSRCAFARRLR